MKYDLLTLMQEFKKHIEWFNENKKQPLEDDIEFTFENFYKWLQFEINKYQ